MIQFKSVLHKEFSPRVTVTSALPYVNGVKHLGNIAGSLLPADVFHRFLDLFGVDNIFICGTDDHGTAIEIAAAEEGLSPKDYSSKYCKIQKGIYDLWNFDFSFFGRTSSESNHKITQEMLLSAEENGYILRQTLTIPYCTECRRFLPDRYIIGTCPVCSYDSARGDQCEKCSTLLDPKDLKEARCTLCDKSDIEFREEKHLFLDLPALQDKLREWIEKNKHWPANVRNLALGWLNEGLKPRCVTRNLEWGVRIPLEGYEHLVNYCWFDAPIAYISITKDAYDSGAIKDWKKYWKDSKIYHFIGKDNIPFHTIIWPAILLSARDSEKRDTNYLLPYFVAGYEYLNWSGQKFSTSKGVGIFSDEALELFPVDYWRFYLSYVLPESKDSNFDWQDFRNRINNELIANYGNLFYRVTYFIKEYFDGRVPKGVLDKDGEQLFVAIKDAKERIEELVGDVQLREALKEALMVSGKANKFFQDKKPWDAIKKDPYSAANTLFTAANALRSLSIMLYPYMPTTAEAALAAIGVEKKDIKWDSIGKIKLHAGARIEPKLLFKKIEKEEFDKAVIYVSKYTKKKEVKETGITQKEGKPMIKFGDFEKLDLAVGTVLDAADHPNADKLYVLQVDLGKEIRQIVVGLKGIYSKDELRGRQIILIANLEPRELRGAKSHGMLLASEDGTIISPMRRVPNGSRIK